MRIEGTGSRVFNVSVEKRDDNDKESLKANKQDEDKKSFSVYSKKRSKFDALIKNLNEIKDNYKKQKETIMATDFDDEKIKKSMIKEINEKITDIENQILEIQTQKKQEELEKEKEKFENNEENKQYNETGDEVRDGIVIAKSLNDIIDAKVSLDRIHMLKGIKTRGAIESQYIKVDDNPNSYNNIRMAKIKLADIKVDMGVAKEIGRSNHSSKSIHENIMTDIIEDNQKLKIEKEEAKKEDSEYNKSVEGKAINEKV